VIIRLVPDLIVLLRGGPADGQKVELPAPLAEEVEFEVARTVRFSLVESVAGSVPLVSGQRTKKATRHRYRLMQREPPVMEWTGRVPSE